MLIPFIELHRRFKFIPEGVVHLGANSGQEAVEYHRWGVRNVIWVEALPDVFLELKRNVSHYPGQLALCACLSNVDGQKVPFNVANNQGQSSSFLEFGTHSKEHPTVKFTRRIELETIRLDTLFRKFGFSLPGTKWLLNADLQGAELLALQGMGELMHHFSYAYLEVNERELYKGCALVGEIDSFLAQHGFVGQMCKMTGFGWGDKFYTKA